MARQRSFTPFVGAGMIRPAEARGAARLFGPEETRPYAYPVGPLLTLQGLQRFSAFRRGRRPRRPAEIGDAASSPGEHCPPLRFNPLHLSPNIPYPPPRQRSHNQAGGGGEGEVPEHWDEVGVDIAVHFGEQHPAQRGKSAQNPDARNRPEPRRRAAVARDANAKRRRKRRGPDAEQRPRRKT